jgi:hypothetical protein
MDLLLGMARIERELRIRKRFVLRNWHHRKGMGVVARRRLSDNTEIVERRASSMLDHSQ